MFWCFGWIISRKIKKERVFLIILMAFLNVYGYHAKSSITGSESTGNNFNPGGNFEISETKLSEMCSFVADTSCKKCIELAACFWCGRSRKNSNGECYALIDQKAVYECQGQHVYKDGFCNYNDISETFNYSEMKEKGILLNLLNLLKKLHSLSNNSNKEKLNELVKLNFSKPSMKSFVSEAKSENHLTQVNSKSSVDEQKNFSTTVIMENKTISVNITSLLKSNNELTYKNSTTNLYVHHSQECSHSENYLCESSICVWCDILKRCINKIEFKRSECDPSFFTVKKVVQVEGSCRTRVSCLTCTESDDCYWCDKTKLCHPFIDSSLISSECSDKWFHHSCSNHSPILFFLLPALGCLLLMGVGYTCVKNCYYQQLKPVEVKLEERPILFKEKNGRTIYQIAESEEEDEDERSLAEKSGSMYQKHGKNHPSVW